MSKVNKVIFEINKQVEPCYKAQNNAFGPLNYLFLCNLITKHKVKNILDVGTGEGSFVSELAKRNKNVRFEAVDINPDLIDLETLFRDYNLAKSKQVKFPDRHYSSPHKFQITFYPLVLTILNQLFI